MTAERAAELFRANGFTADRAAIGKLLAYERMLLEWNSRINLVSRRDTADAFVRQIVGSLAFLFACRLAPGTALLDVGTGGGLPGIPVAILHPGISVTMVDSIEKKVKAVGEMIAALELKNARVLRGRVEELDPSKTGRFDYIVARGVGSSAEIVGWTARLLRGAQGSRKTARDLAENHPATIPPGTFILLKGGDLEAELKALKSVSGNAEVLVKPLAVAGAEEVLTDKKVILVTP